MSALTNALDELASISPTDTTEARAELAAITTRLQEAEAVIKPFANDDFCIALSGNFEGDLSPVFQRVQAMLTLGDFRRVRAWLKGGN